MLGHIDVARLVQSIAPDLHAAAQRGEMLLRVSARSLVARAWVAASGATSTCYRVHTVAAWRGFIASGGSLDATLGKHSFRTNLTRVLRYAFKPWPCTSGEQRVGDVLEMVFSQAPRSPAP